MISLLTMGAGNVIVLEETIKSALTVCDEIIYGDLLLFQEDREILGLYEKKYPVKIIKFPFDYIFQNGFSAILNALATHAKNDLVMYLNTSEIIEKDNGILKLISPDYNCYYFDHATDKHRWFRTYNKHELKWSGKIHESLIGEHRPYHKPIFRMADLEKDMYSSFKAAVFNDLKEIVYFTQYLKLIDEPEGIGATDPGWLKFVEDNYESMKYRLQQKGKRVKALNDGDLNAYLSDCFSNKEFEQQRFESNIGIEYQGDKRYLL